MALDSGRGQIYPARKGKGSSGGAKFIPPEEMPPKRRGALVVASENYSQRSALRGSWRRGREGNLAASSLGSEGGAVR
jgi:hypothetical protein